MTDDEEEGLVNEALKPGKKEEEQSKKKIVDEALKQENNALNER